MERPETTQENRTTNEIVAEQNQQPTRVSHNESRRRALARFKKMGPLELSLLERVEEGLHRDRAPAPEEPAPAPKEIELSTKTGKKIKKYTGEKQVLAVTGWAKVNELYQKYLMELATKAILGSLMLVVV